MTANEDLHNARGWLNRASDVLTGAEDYLSAVEYAHAAAVVGNGFVNLAHATRALEAMEESAKVTARQLVAFDAIADAADRTGDPTLKAAAEREERAEAEARPHDDEPATCSFTTLDRGPCTLKADHSAPFHRLANGEDFDSAGRLIDRTRFLGFTSHGHPADTKTPPEGFDWPDLVARCGGPGMCHECATDAERLREEADRG